MIVLFCDNLTSQSGWGKYTRDILDILKSKKNLENIIVICSKKNKDIQFKQYNFLRPPGEYLSNPFLIFLDIRKIKNLFSQFSSDYKIIHFTVEPYVLFLPFIKNFFDKKIITVHGSYSLILYHSRKLKFLFKIAIKYINSIIYVSHYTKKKVKHIFINSNSKQKVITNSIPFQNRPIVHKKKNYFISIGSIKPRKGHHHLIPVIKNLKKNNSNFKLDIIGSIEDRLYYEILKKKISKEKLGNFIKFTDFINEKNLENKLKKSKLLILLSDDVGNKFEGFGLVYLEALNYNMHVVISKKSGASCLKIPYKSGIISEPSNYRKICNYMQDVIDGNININYKFNKNFLKKSFSEYKKKIKLIYKY